MFAPSFIRGAVDSLNKRKTAAAFAAVASEDTALANRADEIADGGTVAANVIDDGRGCTFAGRSGFFAEQAFLLLAQIGGDQPIALGDQRSFGPRDFDAAIVTGIRVCHRSFPRWVASDSIVFRASIAAADWHAASG